MTQTFSRSSAVKRWLRDNAHPLTIREPEAPLTDLEPSARPESRIGWQSAYRRSAWGQLREVAVSVHRLLEDNSGGSGAAISGGFSLLDR